MSDTGTGGGGLTRELQRKAHRFISGGAHTYSRGDDQFPANAPAVVARGKGAWTWDADGRRFLDFGMALRAVTVGYDYERISNAAIAQIRNGNLLTRPAQIEVEAAEALCEHVPYVDMVKFGKNGSTVTSAGVKLARAHTGRRVVARCAEHPFFSYDDWFIGSTNVRAGIPDEVSALTATFRFNDLASLERVFEQHPGDVALVIMEPATTTEPVRDENGRTFLHDVQDLCRLHGAVFMLDEMITGFRWHLQGAAVHYGVEPDLVAFGKGMANGFSVAALGGRKDIMELGGLFHDRERVFLVSTTYGPELSSLGAFVETLDVYREIGVVEHLWGFGERLLAGMREVARDAGVHERFELVGLPCAPNYVTRDAAGEPSLAFRTLFSQEMIRGGVLMPWIALSLSHGDAELDAALTATRAALEVYARALEDGPEQHLEGPVIKPVFRRFN